MQEYLIKMKKPESRKEEESRRIKRRSPKTFLEDGQLKRRNNPNPQLVISSEEAQSGISIHFMKTLDTEWKMNLIEGLKQDIDGEKGRNQSRNGLNLVWSAKREDKDYKGRKEGVQKHQKCLKGSELMQFISNMEDGSTWLWQEMIFQDDQKKL
ncbi:hypothetical protein O181_089940 [Austropuccinia psidii MF-1]|uniref:Uncharacterized protein n=1 Tax=Austropuccinia psidii MF-1 TaxID=1389203 RepID=A0A9Q3IUU7_9BASI|nr:hypothetical protein [Austropuccinia psidii MF-1]